jgi:DNA-binding NtrC family response regulator
MTARATAVRRLLTVRRAMRLVLFPAPQRPIRVRSIGPPEAFAPMTHTLGSTQGTRSSTPPRPSGPPDFVRVVVAYSLDAACIGALRVLGEDALIVGRVGGGLALPDPRLSRAHASLELRDGRAFVRDLGSRNGTFVNGERVETAPLNDQDVLRVADHVLVVQALHGDDVRRAVEAPPSLPCLVGDGRAMRTLRDDVARVAPGDVPVLLLGETGSGKELVASELHRLSARTGPFVPVNCAAIPEHLAESELFGYVRGAFTGATSDGVGLFAAAHGGTLLLDEIGEMPIALQAKLLRALATGETRRVGETSVRKVDVRVVAATNVDLLEAVGADRFRADLLARLAGHVVSVPPLRERREDVLPLAAHFLARALGGRPTAPNELLASTISPDAAEALVRHDWPFNVRGLEQTMRSAVTRIDDRRLELAHLGADFRAASSAGHRTSSPTAASPLLRVLEVRPDAIPSADELRAVIEHFGGNVSKVAAFFGKERRQIYRWAERHAIDLEALRDE